MGGGATILHLSFDIPLSASISVPLVALVTNAQDLQRQFLQSRRIVVTFRTTTVGLDKMREPLQKLGLTYVDDLSELK